MADQKFRSQSRDPGSSHVSPSSGGRERFTQRSEDPLAELARLIGQDDPFADFQNEPQGRGRAASNGFDPRNGAGNARNGNGRAYPDDGFDDRDPYARDPEPVRARRAADQDSRYAEPAPARNNGRAPYAYGGRREEPVIARAPQRAPEPDFGHEPEDDEHYQPQPAARRQAPQQPAYAPEHEDEYEDPRYARAPRGNGYDDPQQAYDPRYDRQGTAGYEPEYEEQYADEYGEEAYDQPAPNSKRWLYAAAAAAVGLLVIGVAGVYGYRALFGKHSGGSVATIRPSDSPNKVPPQANAQNSPEGGGQKLIYDRLDGPKQGERIVSREEQPADVANGGRIAMTPQPVDPTPMPAPAGGRMVSAPGAVTAFAPVPAPAQNVPAAISAPPPAPSAATAPSGEPRRVRTTTVRADGTIVDGQRAAPAARQAPSQPLALSPQQAQADDDPDAQTSAAPGRTANLAPRATQPASNQQPWGGVQPAAPQQTSNYVPAGSYVVQVASQKTEVDARTSWQQLQSKYSNVFGNYQASIKRVDLGDRGTFYRAMLGPFANRDQAYEMCQNLKAAGGECIVQRN